MRQHCLSDDLTLALLTPENAIALSQLVRQNHQILSKWLNWVNHNNSVESSEAFIQLMSEDFEHGVKYSYGIFYRETLVGMIALNKTSKGTVNLTYWLDKSHQGKGIITICATHLTQYALNELGYHRVMIRCATENKKSSAVPERLGFIHEGTARGDYWLNGQYIDIEVYALLKSDLP